MGSGRQGWLRQGRPYYMQDELRAVRSGGKTVKMLKCSLTDFYMLHQFSASPNPLEGHFTLTLGLVFSVAFFFFFKILGELFLCVLSKHVKLLFQRLGLQTGHNCVCMRSCVLSSPLSLVHSDICLLMCLGRCPHSLTCVLAHTYMWHPTLVHTSDSNVNHPLYNNDLSLITLSFRDVYTTVTGESNERLWNRKGWLGLMTSFYKHNLL